MNVRLTPEAEADIADARRWYRQRGVRAADGFMRAVGAALDLIKQYPEGQPIVYRTARRVLLPRFPYTLLYFCDGEVAVVFGCFHSVRDPRVWQERSDAALD